MYKCTTFLHITQKTLLFDQQCITVNRQRLSQSNRTRWAKLNESFVSIFMTYVEWASKFIDVKCDA